MAIGIHYTALILASQTSSYKTGILAYRVTNLTAPPQILEVQNHFIPSGTLQWFRAQFGPILVYTKCQTFSFKMVFMLNLMILLEIYSPMMYIVPLKQQFCMLLSMLYFARPV